MLRQVLRAGLIAAMVLAGCGEGEPESLSFEDSPRSLRAVTLGPSAVRLEWPQVKDPRLVGYRIERRVGLAGPWEVLQDALAPGPDSSMIFFDTSVAPDRDYGYRVAAVFVLNELGPWSVVAGARSAPVPGVLVSIATLTQSEQFADPDGYLLAITAPTGDTLLRTRIGSEASGRPIETRLDSLGPGTYAVLLRSLAPNCLATTASDPGAPADSTFPAVVVDSGTGTLRRVDIGVRCRDTTRGEIAVRVNVTGGGSDSSGFSVRLTGTADDSSLPDSVRIVFARSGIGSGFGGAVRFVDLRPGNYEVTLEDVAANCALAGDPTKERRVQALQTDSVSYEVDCPLDGGGAGRSIPARYTCCDRRGRLRR